MSNQIDNLFKKKLEGHTMEPAPGAWAKISASASKKNKAVIWFRAAAVLLLMVSAIWLFSNTEENAPEQVAEVVNELSNEQPVAAQKETNETSSSEESITQSPNSSAQKPKVQLVAKENRPKEIEQQKIELINEPLESIALTSVNSLEGDSKIAIAASSTEEIKQPIVIVYELESYNIKTEPNIEIDPLSQKKNGIKKVLDVANNIRTGDNPLSGLRQAKEDLFALNFKKEDKKNNR